MHSTLIPLLLQFSVLVGHGGHKAGRLPFALRVALTYLKIGNCPANSHAPGSAGIRSLSSCLPQELESRTTPSGNNSSPGNAAQGTWGWLDIFLVGTPPFLSLPLSFSLPSLPLSLERECEGMPAPDTHACASSGSIHLKTCNQHMMGLTCHCLLDVTAS